MAKKFESLSPEHQAFISEQKIFFTGSAAATGHVNVSPKDGASLRVINANTVAYVDLTGSGCETAAHLKNDGRLTIMFCAFGDAPKILRLYGKGRSILSTTTEFITLLSTEFAMPEPPGARQIVVLNVDLVLTSCGFGVPAFDYSGTRDTLMRWASAKGKAGLAEYRKQNNQFSVDGFETGLLELNRSADSSAVGNSRPEPPDTDLRYRQQDCPKT